MAYIVNTTLTDTANAATYDVVLGAHQANDLLLVFLTQDVGGTTITTASSGWNILVQERSGTAVRHAVAYKIATSSAESSPQFSGATDDWLGACVVVRDADPTNPFGASPADGTDYNATAYSTATSYVAGALTTAADGCLVFYSFGVDGNSTTQVLRGEINDTRGVIRQIGSAAINQAVSVLQQESAGAIPTPTFYGSNAVADGVVCAVRNKSGGALQPDIRPTINELRWYAGVGSNREGAPTWQAPNSFAASINGITCSSTAPTVATNGTSSDADANFGLFTTLTSVESTTGAWVGGTHAISSTDMSSKICAITCYHNVGSSLSVLGADGDIIGFSDGTNWVAYQMMSKANSLTTPYTAVIALGSATPYASSGSINWSAVTRVGYFRHRIGSATTSITMGVKNLALFDSVALTGGGNGRPATWADYQAALVSWGAYKWAELQGTQQVLAKTDIQIGDGGSNTTYFDASASSIEFPPAFDLAPGKSIKWNANANSIALTVKAGASDTINFASGVAASETQQLLTVDSASNTGASYSFAQSFVGFAPTWKTGVNPSGSTFSECGEIDAKGSDWTDCTIKKTTSTDAAIAFSEDGGSMTRCTIDVTGTSAAYHLELGTAVTAITLADVAFTGTPGTDKVHVKKTTGTVTITTSGTTSLVAGDVTSDGATVSIVAPTVERGLEFTGLLAGSFVRVVKNSDQSELFIDTNSATTETWDDATAGSLDVSYMVMRVGYEPIGPISVTVTGAVGTGIQSVPIVQVPARWYQASSGLTINTNAFVNASTKKFGLTTASTLQNFASYLLEQWIALGGTGGAFANKPWPLAANGPNSFTWLDGWEADLTTYPNTISNFSRDGMRYLDGNGVMTAQWCALLSAGVSAGMQVRYQQTDGGTTVNAATTGNIDQLIQIYGDATHGNFDRRGYLVAKVQESGYDQAEVDVVAQYGTLEDQLYVIALAPAANGVATGNPSLANPPTITDHGASPVTWNGGPMSITITDSAAGNSGTDIMRWLRYYFEAGGTFQGKDAFNWHDLVQTNGSNFKTVRGTIYGDTGATLKGVRVLTNAGAAHPNFDLFTFDDGTTYAPPPAATVTISGLTSGSRVQLYDTLNSVELYNDVVGGTSLNYSETYSVDRTVRARITYVSGTSAKEMIEATVGTITSSAPDISYIASQSDDDTYNTNAIDGSTVTNITINDSTDRVEIAIAGGAVTWGQIYAYQVYWLNTATGIQDDFAFIESPDPANYILTNFKIKNTHATNPLTISGGWGRDSSTGLSATIIDTTSTSNIYLTADHVIPYATGSGVTSQDKIDIASEVLLQAQSTPIYSDARKMNGATITGTGTSGDKWRGV